MFGIFKRKSSTKHTLSISALEADAEREYHLTSDRRMAELQSLKRQIESLTYQPKTQDNYDEIRNLSSKADDIVRAMNRITTESEQIPFRNVNKQISEIIKAY